jgi:hypothetical protein
MPMTLEAYKNKIKIKVDKQIIEKITKNTETQTESN